jgi:hypothetical protein
MSNGERKGYYELKHVSFSFVTFIVASAMCNFHNTFPPYQEFRVRVKRREVAMMEED